MAMAAAAAARRLAAGSPTMKTLPIKFVARRCGSASPDVDTKLADVAKELVKVLKEPPSEANYAKAHELAKELHMFFKAPVKALTLNDIAIKEINLRLSKLESSHSLYSNFLFGMTSFFSAAILAQSVASSSQQTKLSAVESKLESQEKSVAKLNSKLLKQDYQMKLMGRHECTCPSCKECPGDDDLPDAEAAIPDVPIATDDNIPAEGTWSVTSWLKWLSGA